MTRDLLYEVALGETGPPVLGCLRLGWTFCTKLSWVRHDFLYQVVLDEAGPPVLGCLG